MEVLAEVSVVPTRDDWVASMCRLTRALPATRKMYRRNFLSWVATGSIVIPIVAGIGYFRGSSHAQALDWAVLFGACAVLVWVVYGAATLSPRRHWRRIDHGIARAAAKGDVPVSTTPFTVTIHRDGLTVASADELSTLLWTAETRLSREGGAVYLDLRDGVSLQIPERACSTGQELEAFVAAAEECIASAEPSRQAAASA